MRMRLFPFSLAGKAKEWRRTLPPNSITSWEQLAEQFVTRFFSQAKQAQVRADIASFQMYDGESLYEVWEHFKELIRICPNHGVSDWGIIHTFYHGLTPPLKATVDAAAGGDLLDFTYPETYRLLEKLSKKHVQWPSTRNNASKKAGVLELSSTDALSAQMASLQNTIKNWKPMEQKKPTEWLDNNNRSNDNYQGNNNRGWKSQNNAGGSGGSYQNRPPYPRQNHQNWDKGEGKSQSFETFVKEYMNQNSAAMRSLETQIGQLAGALKQRQPGTLPSDTEKPSQENQERCNAISLRDGKTLPPPDLVARSRKRELARQPMEEGVEEATDPQPLEAQTESREKVQNDDLTEVTPVATTSGADVGAMKDNEPVSVPTYVPPCKRRSEPIEPPFPQRLKKQHEDRQFSKFLDLLKQLHINVPLVEALEQMPSYAKFMKDVLSKKRRIEEFETVALTEESCKYLTKIPPKLKDPGILPPSRVQLGRTTLVEHFVIWARV
ncbi:uncharacterized protein LOC133285404 [Gastrolobium bilobum]|uniref:uncharacterized protein LOC133285404 n=1 Tax=Gastrolobium bilobum TaxID=150636 RepID=UPI002AAF811A|nr:uncharacterized protein LOC133285404 [Gastrolobium bilobum]